MSQENYNLKSPDNQAITSEVESRVSLLSIAQAIEAYTDQRYYMLPALVSPESTKIIHNETRRLSSKRVRCGIGNVTWNEQSIEPGSIAYGFFKQQGIVDIIKAMTDKQRIDKLIAWTSVYSQQEFINPHRDVAGTVQLLLCLQAPPSPENGGILHVSGQELFLNPGDALAFEATTLEHSTTPLVATEQVPDPKRTVLVGRYFMEDVLL